MIWRQAEAYLLTVSQHKGKQASCTYSRGYKYKVRGADPRKCTKPATGFHCNFSTLFAAANLCPCPTDTRRGLDKMEEPDECHGYVVIGNFRCDVYWPNFIIGKRLRNNHQCKAFYYEFPSRQTLQVSSYHHTQIQQIVEWLHQHKVDYRDGYVYLGEKEVTLHDGKDSLPFAASSAQTSGPMSELRGVASTVETVSGLSDLSASTFQAIQYIGR